MKLEFTQAELADFREALSTEWLETNGLGGYASSTILNCHSRKYHGLLVTRLPRPSGCFVLVSALEDAVETAAGRALPLASHEYCGNTIHPDGHVRQTRFEQELMPTFTYGCGDFTVTRRIQMIQGRDLTLLRYDLTGTPPGGGATLAFRPLLAFRDIHHITRANGTLDGAITLLPDGFSIAPYAALPRLHLQTTPPPACTPEPAWYYKFFYATDARYGLEHAEDLFTPALVRLPLAAGTPVYIALATGPVSEPLAELWAAEEQRRRRAATADLARLPDGAGLDEPAVRLELSLHRAARQFMLRLPSGGAALHAGYHWFGPWGRDTLIALPGIAFLNGEREFGAEILKSLARLEKEGLLPNFINPDGSTAYTAVDPSLWFFWAVQQYLAGGGSLETVRREFWPTMLAILRNFQRGTRSGLLVDVENGLLRAGAPALAVTWMDAQVGGRPIVPRWGYMVEINALWYNALCFVEDLAHRHFRETLEGVLDSDASIRVRHAFVQKFWKTDGSGLYDFVNESTQDGSLRPNALLAVSLPHSPLSTEQQKVVLAGIRRELFTPFGLRSLTPADLRYRGVCQGESWVRELAYHQGSVWPWFLPHFAEALFRVEGRTPETEALFQPVIAAFVQHLRIGGVGSISEVFDGDEPHTQRGAISQAWNVAELLRLLHLLTRPAAPAAPSQAETAEAAPAPTPAPAPKRPRQTAAKPRTAKAAPAKPRGRRPAAG
ncbi:MAG: amylo-alpha-1,6-glucosidase [Lentisphaeria bacterium]|jgi:predicted glycogen debranching enzyme